MHTFPLTCHILRGIPPFGLRGTGCVFSNRRDQIGGISGRYTCCMWRWGKSLGSATTVTIHVLRQPFSRRHFPLWFLRKREVVLSELPKIDKHVTLLRPHPSTHTHTPYFLLVSITISLVGYTFRCSCLCTYQLRSVHYPQTECGECLFAYFRHPSIRGATPLR